MSGRFNKTEINMKKSMFHMDFALNYYILYVFNKYDKLTLNKKTLWNDRHQTDITAFINSQLIHICPMIFLSAKNGISVPSKSCLSEGTLSFHKAKTEGSICPSLSLGPSDLKYSSKSCALPWAYCHIPLENVTSKSHNNSLVSELHLIFLFF